MCVQKAVGTLITFSILVFLAGCEAMDNLLPSAEIYKINAKINGVTLDECSFADSNDRIRPFFEESVSNDPDLTSLMVFLKDSKGDVAGWKVLYLLDNIPSHDVSAMYSSSVILTENYNENDLPQTQYTNGGELVIPVKRPDADLPVFPLPENLPVGRYTITYQIMSGKNILQRTEKSIFYLGRTAFSYEGIKVCLPGIAKSSQLIPSGTMLMLEADLAFDSRIDPYIIWYEGRRIIGEGRFSGGAGQLFWKAPDHSGFFSISAAVFPVQDFEGLTGYQKDISLLVSTKNENIHLVSENISQLTHRYVFDGNLNDSKNIDSQEAALKPAAENFPKWISANGTYGLASGFDNSFVLPDVSISANENEWQTLFRVRPVNDGEIFSVIFDNSDDVSMRVFVKGGKIVLMLISPSRTDSRSFNLPVGSAGQGSLLAANRGAFFTAGISFSIGSGSLSARLNILGESLIDDAVPIVLNAKIENRFRILLGFAAQNDTDDEEAVVPPEITALWDEFALYHKPPMEILVADLIGSPEDQIVSADRILN